MSNPSARPLVTLTYAQSIDGSIAAHPGTPLELSSPESLTFTHQLRASHDAILVGIGTVLADNPELTVRYAEGPSPRPIILDSQLRCPSNARFLDPARHPIIVASPLASRDRDRELQSVGAWVWRLPAIATDESRIDLLALVERLGAEGIGTLMVEGGASVITSFLKARLVDRLVVTIAPSIIGGVRGVNELLAGPTAQFPRLRNATMRPVGRDWVLSGQVE